MTTNELIDHYGDREKAMKASGAYRQLWDYWEKNGIPLGRQAEIQIKTRGKLKADNREKETR